MAEHWEQGNAARELSYSDRHNPYRPVDYAARLQNAGRRPSSAAPSANYAPGQLYGRPMTPPRAFDAPPAYDPDYPPQAMPAPKAAPQMELPGYMQPQPSLPPMYAQPMQYNPEPARPAQRRRSQTAAADARVGTPYSAALFDHQPTAVMPSGQEDVPFAGRSEADMAWYAETPAWPQDEEPMYAQTGASIPYDDMLEDRPWRDPFTPAAPKDEESAHAAPEKKTKAKAKAAPKTQRPPVRVGRLIALAASIVMLLFCLITGGRIVLELTRTEAQRNDYRERTGQELFNGAARVDLLPDGQTFAPTPAPTPTPYVPRPTPTPVIPIKEAAVLSLGSQMEGVVQEAEATDEPVLRTKLKTYPKNPLRNIQPAISELVKANADVKGHLVIDGVLDEIVMQRNNTYYLNHNSLGTTSEAGAVFADESCSFRLPPENLLLRGQCSIAGKSFHPLLQYATGGSAFASSASTARLTTLYEEETYVLFAVIVADSDPVSPGYFNYASHPTFTTDDAMMTYVQNARKHSLYQFNVDVQPSDRLLTLATLGGEDTLVLLYRMARDGENFR